MERNIYIRFLRQQNIESNNQAPGAGTCWSHVLILNAESSISGAIFNIMKSAFALYHHDVDIVAD